MEGIQHTGCYHCGLPVSQSDNFRTVVLGKTRDMCCPGCQAVAKAIVDSGLEDYYRFRTELAEKGDEQLTQTLAALETYDDEEIIQEFVVQDGLAQQIQLTIEGISCAACGWLIEKQLAKLTGIRQVSVNVSSRRASISWLPEQLKLSEILTKIENIGYHALPFQPDQHELSYQKEHKAFLKKLGLSGLMSMQVMMLAIGLYFGIFGSIDPQTKSYFHWVSLVLTLPVVSYCGSGFYISALNSLRAGSVNMDLSISIAILGTFFSSAWATFTKSGEIYFESVCMFIFLLLVSRFLEHRSRHQAAQISANMLKYVPLTASRIQGEQVEKVLARKLSVNDLVLVKAGETIPVDGEIIDGASYIDESMLTGEFEPVSKNVGSDVFGGTINKSNVIKVRVKRGLKDALVNQIIRMQEFALAEKPAVAHFADRTSRHFVVIVLAIALISYLVWLTIDPARAYWIAIAVLVATCPCALALATPSALTSAMARLNKLGFLVKKADVLEQINNVNTVVFDKTGTLTEGQFSLDKFENFSADSSEHVLNVIANLEHYSEHPIAKAFAITGKLTVLNPKIEVGLGISGNVNSVDYRLGSATFMRNAIPESMQWACVFLETNDMILACCSLQDKIKLGSAKLLSDLSSKELLLLSGDNLVNVSKVADQLGFKHYDYGHTPEQKLKKIRQLKEDEKSVMMIGDGINDAPVLAAANVSIAVGNASDIAKRSADVILLGSNLDNIPVLFEMAKRTHSKIKQNMAWAIGYNLLILPLAIFGLLTPWMAVIGMSLSSIIVVSNSVRLTK